MLPLSTRGVAWCDIEDDEMPEPKTETTVESIKVDQSPSKSKRKPRKMKERPVVDVSSPMNPTGQTQPAAGGSAQVTLGDLGLHCTAWNQATSPTSPTSPHGAWAQKPLEVMSTAPMSMAPMEKRSPPVFLPPGAFVSSPMAGGKHLGDASSRMVTGTSPNMQHPDQMRFLPPGSPGATGMAPTPKGLWDASCRTPVNTPVAPVNTPVAMSWPDAPPEGKSGAWPTAHAPLGAPPMAGPWGPQAADALRVFFGNTAVPTGEELAARLQAAAPESYED